MEIKNNLRFLLALGNQKVVILKQTEGTDIYSSEIKKSDHISIRHVWEAVSKA